MVKDEVRELSAYEKLRAARIKRNQEVLGKLGLDKNPTTSKKKKSSGTTRSDAARETTSGSSSSSNAGGESNTHSAIATSIAWTKPSRQVRLPSYVDDVQDDEGSTSSVVKRKSSDISGSCGGNPDLNFNVDGDPYDPDLDYSGSEYENENEENEGEVENGSRSVTALATKSTTNESKKVTKSAIAVSNSSSSSNNINSNSKSSSSSSNKRTYNTLTKKQVDLVRKLGPQAMLLGWEAIAKQLGGKRSAHACSSYYNTWVKTTPSQGS
jgi:hypothetical protein